MKPVKATHIAISCLIVGSLSSCSLVTVPLKVTGKAVTTGVSVAGAAAERAIGNDQED